MCNNQLACVEDGEIVYYKCSQVKQLKEAWMKEFREYNQSEKVEEFLGIDVAFDTYEKMIFQFIEKCADPWNITDRIKEAKRKREVGQSPWMM